MKKKILLIDDDQIFHYLHSKVIALAGIEADIITAGHGLEGMEIITKMIENGEELPTEVFIDLNMPNMNGFEFIRAVNDLDFPGKSQMKMIVVTSSVNSADRVIADELGIKYFLTKPLLVRDVAEVLAVNANRE
ncbi:MAG TPA: response regulator [Chryseosolibacter sp.]